MEPGHNESHHTKYIPAARTLKALTVRGWRSNAVLVLKASSLVFMGCFWSRQLKFPP